MKLIPVVVLILLLTSCVSQIEEPPLSEMEVHNYPKVASWLSKKDELITSGKPYDLVMTGWVTPEEAQKFKKMNPDILIFAGVTVNWVYDNKDWKKFLETIASADGTTRVIKENMFLRRPDGKKCAFGWASSEWGHQEIYAMDPTNPEWKELVITVYKTILDQPQHDGVIVDMVIDVSWCPDVISDEEWVSAIKDILQKIKSMTDARNKLVVFNAGREFSDIDQYAEYMDGYVMENFLGVWGADYDTGLKAADNPYMVVFAVDTDDTGVKDLKRMRLGLTLSLLNDNTYFAYDFGPRDHGQAWWFPEYDVELGAPLQEYYKKDNAYWRAFEKGIVISSPYVDVTVTFDPPYTDVTTGVTSQSFVIEKGDGRIFVRSESCSIFLRTCII
ncbi:MAG: hypothetical protein AYK19_13075 [Theionarchaea archaeon DG-70-1]|nr:MAG: hypothetical protein AYK19_13075 [Theionarchaea archaeon DG-70-1]